MEKEVLEERLYWIKSLLETMNSGNFETLRDTALKTVDRIIFDKDKIVSNSFLPPQANTGVGEEKLRNQQQRQTFDMQIMKKFEYLREMDATKEDLIKFGEEGWELVSVVNKMSSLFYFFKRVL